MVGTCGMIGANDLLACFAAGSAINWDGEFLDETVTRNDEVNSCVDVLLNFGGFMYLGTVIPWSEFHQPETTGITWWRLVCLGIMVILFRRVPALLLAYKFMPEVCANFKDALFMGYFGPIGVGAVFYVEHTLHLFPELGEGDEDETRLVLLLRPVVYFLVVFSILVHGLSIPLLNVAYTYAGVEYVTDDAVTLRRKSMHEPIPANAKLMMNEDDEDDEDAGTVVEYNRFFRPSVSSVAARSGLPVFGDPDYAARQHARARTPSREPNPGPRGREVVDREDLV